MKNTEFDVIIVGAGVAGLNCAISLQAGGLSVALLEADDRPGGRIRTDELDGFHLDRGFQVLLTAYPECRRALDFGRLALGRFEPGTLIWSGRKLVEMMDPIRRPARLRKALFNPIGKVSDKLKVGRLKASLALSSIEALYGKQECSTLLHLESLGFSRGFVNAFMRPFFGGIFLEEDLSTSSRMFEFVFKMFGEGYAALPTGGMQAIPDQLASQLERGTLRTVTRVSALDPGRVTTSEGKAITAKAIVLATDMSNAAALESGIDDRTWNPTNCLYFATEKSPLNSRCIVLNGSGSGQISNVAIPSDIAPGYAPPGQSLVCVSLRPGSPIDPDSVRAELAGWFGTKAKDFRFLRTYQIPHALPRQEPDDNAFGQAPLKLESGVWVAGDHRYSSSIEGAMASGRAVAEAILNEVTS